MNSKNKMKNKQKKLTELLEKELKLKKELEDYLRLCPFTEKCAESDHGSEEICRNDYETCKNYRQFKKEETKEYEK